MRAYIDRSEEDLSAWLYSADELVQKDWIVMGRLQRSS
mgnify:CR=1 FL=1